MSSRYHVVYMRSHILCLGYGIPMHRLRIYYAPLKMHDICMSDAWHMHDICITSATSWWRGEEGSVFRVWRVWRVWKIESLKSLRVRSVFNVPCSALWGQKFEGFVSLKVWRVWGCVPRSVFRVIGTVVWRVWKFKEFEEFEEFEERPGFEFLQFIPVFSELWFWHCIPGHL